MNKDVYNQAEKLIHDMKLPLTLMYTNIQLLEAMGVAEEAAEAVESIKRNWYRVMKLLTDLSDFEKITGGKMAPRYRNMDIVKLVREVTEVTAALAQNKSIELSFFSDADSVICAIDKEIIERILLNLISNSIKHIEPNKNIKVTLLNLGSYIKISVEDNGAGIKEKTEKKKGSGLGLHIVDDLTALIGGELSIETGPRGTKASLQIPSQTTAKEEYEPLLLDDFYYYNIFEIELSERL